MCQRAERVQKLECVEAERRGGEEENRAWRVG